MRSRASLVAAVLCWCLGAEAREVDYAEALALAGSRSPELVAARAREGIGRASVRVAGELPNPTMTVGTASELAKLSVDLSFPIPIFGQREAAIAAGSAELGVIRADTRVAASDSRWSAARAFVALWAAERVAEARHDAAKIAANVETAVVGRVDAGSAPELDRLRAHAERIRAEADAQDADAHVDAAGFELGRWVGLVDALHTRGDPDVPSATPTLETLRGGVADNPLLDREHRDALAALKRADHEKALARPLIVLSAGIGAFDPTIPAPDFHASIGLELPIISWRQPMVDRERASAIAADARREAERIRFATEVATAHRLLMAAAARASTLETAVVPAAEATAVASRDAYTLGHSPLIVVLDAERARVDSRLQLVLAKADRASAWIEIQHITGKI
jgi:cobalt-zinc-cadmium efflux system outer membrane protein